MIDEPLPEPKQPEMMECTVDWLEILFEEWKRRYDANPDGFMSHADFDKDPPKTYGEGAARYFWALDKELGEPND